MVVRRRTTTLKQSNLDRRGPKMKTPEEILAGIRSRREQRWNKQNKAALQIRDDAAGYKAGGYWVSKYKGGNVHYASIRAKDKQGQMLATVPLDAKGNISQQTAIARLLHVDQGTRGKGSRNPVIDLAVDAGKIHKLDELGAFQWYVFPNESDAKGVDDSAADWWKIPAGMKPEDFGFKPGKRATYVSIEGTNQERAKVMAVLNRNFTIAERRKMGGLVIQVKANPGRGAAGFYQHMGSFGAGDTSFHRIVVGKAYLDNATPDKGGPNKNLTFKDTTLTHEVIHYLRNVDATRVDMAKRPASHLSDTDRDVEEAFTEFETSARSKNRLNNREDGYYNYITEGRLPDHARLQTNEAPLKSKAARGFIHDKALHMGLITPGGTLKVTPQQFLIQMDQVTLGAPGAKLDDDTAKLFKGKRGRTAWKQATAKFADSAISRAKIHGKSEVIDTFWQYRSRLDNKDDRSPMMHVSTHVYSPKASINRDAVEELAKAGLPKGGRLYKWNDGTRTQVR